MKIQKWLVNAAAALLFAGASAAVMAVDCAGGVIQDTIVESIEINGEPCLIVGVRVRNGVRVDNSPALMMVENDVGDGVLVTNSAFVGIVNTRISNLSLIVLASGQVAIKDNDVKDGSIRVNGNVSANVNRNDAERDIVCLNNGDLDAFLNHASGEDECFDLF